MKIVVVSGGFDPIHSGHIEYFKAAKELGDQLIVALNSDNWLISKKGKYFMPFKERQAIIENLSCVDRVIDFVDDNQGSAKNALLKIKEMYPKDTITFANGGDRDETNIPEMSLEGIDFLFGIGGSDKKNSSSSILKNWQFYKEERLWGEFYNLFEDHQVKVKELIVHPKQGMSYQRHFKRHEIWLINKGSCVVNYSNDDPGSKQMIKLDKFDHFLVPLGQWHQITNPFELPCHLIEIQYGDECTEDDIERIEYYSS